MLKDITDDGRLLGENEADMLCEIIDGTMEEAIVYAAGSNKSNGVKPMSPTDVTKAIEMLFGIESWWNRSDNRVSIHVGCGPQKSKKRPNEDECSSWKKHSGFR